MSQEAIMQAAVEDKNKIKMKMSEQLNKVIECAQALERTRCEKILTLSNDELLLMGGEMTAQELRTVQAVLTALREKIKNE